MSRRALIAGFVTFGGLCTRPGFAEAALYALFILPSSAPLSTFGSVNVWPPPQVGRAVALSLLASGVDVVCLTSSDSRYAALLSEAARVVPGRDSKAAQQNSPDEAPSARLGIPPGENVFGEPHEPVRGALSRARALSEGVFCRVWVVGKFDPRVRAHIPRDGCAVVFAVTPFKTQILPKPGFSRICLSLQRSYPARRLCGCLCEAYTLKHRPQNLTPSTFTQNQVPCPLTIGGGAERRDVTVIDGGLMRLDVSRCSPRTFPVLLPANTLYACHAAALVHASQVPHPAQTRKSTPPQNRQLNVLVNPKLTILWGY